MIPKKIYLNEAEFDELFTSERMVSCDEPYSDLTVEFTNLSKVWHAPDEEPHPYKNLLTEDENNSCVVRQWANEGYGWIYFAELVKLKRWAYVADLLPKGGEK